MQKIAPRLSFRNMDKPMGMEERVQEKVGQLERLHSNITDCRVMIERRNHRHWKGDLFQVCIDVSVPGATIVVNHTPPQDSAQEPLSATIHHAFDEMRRRLEEHEHRHAHE